MKFRYWLPAIIWMALIFFFSTDLFSAPQTESLTEILLHFLFPYLTPEAVVAVHIGIRKAAHVFVYAFLSIFYVQGLLGRCRPWKGWDWRIGGIAVLLGVLYACSDEWHQSFNPQRTGTIVDVGWDSLGAIGAQVVLAWRVKAGQSSDRPSPS